MMDRESRRIVDRATEFREALLAPHIADEDAKTIYVKCLHSLPLFCFTFLPDDFDGQYGCPPFHREIGKALLDKKSDRLDITAPRNFSKSTVCLLGFGIHQGVYKQRKFIILTFKNISNFIIIILIVNNFIYVIFTSK